MPRSLAYYHLMTVWGLKPAEVDALDTQTINDFFTLKQLSREITPAQ